MALINCSKSLKTPKHINNLANGHTQSQQNVDPAGSQAIGCLIHSLMNDQGEEPVQYKNSSNNNNYCYNNNSNNNNNNNNNHHHHHDNAAAAAAAAATTTTTTTNDDDDDNNNNNNDIIDNNDNNNNNNISRAPFHVKHVQLRWTSTTTENPQPTHA